MIRRQGGKDLDVFEGKKPNVVGAQWVGEKVEREEAGETNKNWITKGLWQAMIGFCSIWGVEGSLDFILQEPRSSSVCCKE